MVFAPITPDNSWFARHGISADWAAVIGALCGLIGTVLTPYLLDWFPSGKKRRQELKEKLNEFAHVLLGTAKEIENGGHPTQYGRRLSALLLFLPAKDSKRLKKVAGKELAELIALDEKVQAIDHNSSAAREARSKLIHDAKALAGTLQGRL